MSICSVATSAVCEHEEQFSLYYPQLEILHCTQSTPVVKNMRTRNEKNRGFFLGKKKKNKKKMHVILEREILGAF